MDERRAEDGPPEEPFDDGAERQPPIEQRRATPVTQQLGRLVVLLLLIVFIVFAVSNSQRVDFSWVVGSSEVLEDSSGETSGGVPLIVLLLAAFIVGALSGAMTMRILKRRRARTSSTDEER